MNKILFFIPNLMYGGAEKVLVNLVNNMDQTKFDITIMTLFDVGVNKQNLKANIKYKYAFKRIFRGNSHIFKLFSPEFLYKLFIKEKYDIAVSYLEGPTARIISGCSDKNTKLVSWIHIEQHTAKNASTSFRSIKEAKKCYNKFDNNICVSKSVLQDFIKIFDFERPIEVLYNTNETEMIFEKSKEPVNDLIFGDHVPTLCSVAKITQTKGYDRLIKIHKRLIDEGLPHRIYILGLGEEKKKLEDWLVKNNLSESFKFVGFRDNPYKYVAKSDLYVCSSFREGFSTAVTEALIVGTPVITTKCSGMEEMLGASQYGMITENDEESLYRGIKELLSSPDLLKSYKVKAAERGKFFSKERTVHAVEDMLERL